MPYPWPPVPQMLGRKLPEDPDEPTRLQRLGASAEMMSKSTMSEKLALASKISQRTGLFMDPRNLSEKLMVDMAPEFVAVTIESYDNPDYLQSRDFILNYPHDEADLSEADDDSIPPVYISTMSCRSCYFEEEHDHDETQEKEYTNYARIAWKDKDIAIFPGSGQPGNRDVDIFVNGAFVPKTMFKVLHRGDTISFHKQSMSQEPFCEYEVCRIAYGGLRPTNYTKEFEEKELARLHRLGTQWSLDTPTAIVIAVAMVVLSGLAMFYFPAIPSNAVN